MENLFNFLKSVDNVVVFVDNRTNERVSFNHSLMAGYFINYYKPMAEDQNFDTTEKEFFSKLKYMLENTIYNPDDYKLTDYRENKEIGLIIIEFN